MPIYDYHCETCGCSFENFGKFEDREIPCPMSILHEGSEERVKCNGVAKRVPSIPAPAKFNCQMPTAPTKHHKYGKP